jgi:hypothetical protein
MLITLHPDNPDGVPATDDEVGQAVGYKAGLSFAAVPPPGAEPAWVRGLYAYLDNKFEAVHAEFEALRSEVQAVHGEVQAVRGEVQAVHGEVQAVRGEVQAVHGEVQAVRGEHWQAILLANSQAGHIAPLYDPTRPGQWALLVAPNPTSRDNLMGFDCES